MTTASAHPEHARRVLLGALTPEEYDCDLETFNARQRERRAGWGPLTEADVEFVCLHIVHVTGGELLALAEGDRQGFWRPIRQASGGTCGLYEGRGRVNVEVHGDTIETEIADRYGSIPWTRVADLWAERMILRPDLVHLLRIALKLRGRFLHEHGAFYPGGYPWPRDSDNPTDEEAARLADHNAWEQCRRAVDREVTRAIRAIADIEPPRQTTLF